MKAAVYHGREDVRIGDIHAPREPGAGQLLVSVARCGICGTDVAEYLTGPHLIPRAPHPASGRSVPLTIGHEFTGRVVAVGPGVEGFAPGDRVASSAVVPCGKCRFCRRGQTNLCEGYHALGLQADGGLAELVLVPQGSCALIGDGCTDDNAALTQPLAVAMHAFHQTPHRSGEPMLLLGAGGIGSLYLAVAKSRGQTVYVADPDPVALGRAEALGADGVADLRNEELAGALRRLTGEPSAATVVECSGREDALKAAVPLVERGGTLMLVGLQTRPATLDLHRLVVDEITVATSQALINAVDLPEAARLLSERELAPWIVDRVIPLADLVKDGLVASAKGEVHGKVLVAVR